MTDERLDQIRRYLAASTDSSYLANRARELLAALEDEKKRAGELKDRLDSLTREAKRFEGAEEQYVTPGGVTQLPLDMRRELGVENGGLVWFLKNDRRRWAAWTTAELDAMFGLPGEARE